MNSQLLKNIIKPAPEASNTCPLSKRDDFAKRYTNTMINKTDKKAGKYFTTISGDILLSAFTNRLNVDGETNSFSATVRELILNGDKYMSKTYELLPGQEFVRHEKNPSRARTAKTAGRAAVNQHDSFVYNL